MACAATAMERSIQFPCMLEFFITHQGRYDSVVAVQELDAQLISVLPSTARLDSPPHPVEDWAVGLPCGMRQASRRAQYL